MKLLDKESKTLLKSPIAKESIGDANMPLI